MNQDPQLIADLKKAWNITDDSDIEDYSKRTDAINLIRGHIDCECMIKTMEIVKTHPEWLFPDSPYESCVQCGAWQILRENTTFCRDCKK